MAHGKTVCMEVFCMENRSLLPGALTVLIITLMVGASELLGEREIIFPEIAAIAAGMLLVPQRPWQTSRTRVLVLISLSAVVGLAVSVLLPLPLWEKMSVAFLLAQVLLIFGGTSFAPLISAAVLPVMLSTESMVYLIAAVLLTAQILLVNYLLERLGLRALEPYHPVHPPEGHAWGRVSLRCLLGVLCIAAAVSLHARYMAAPPMLVAFTEFMNPVNRAKEHPVKAVGLIALCAFAGAASRLVLSVMLGLPLTAAAAAAAMILIWLLREFGLYLPPAAALTVLAMLIPEGDLLVYPVEILVGIAALMGLAKLTDLLAETRSRVGAHMHS